MMFLISDSLEETIRKVFCGRVRVTDGSETATLALNHPRAYVKMVSEITQIRMGKFKRVIRSLQKDEMVQMRQQEMGNFLACETAS